jgi:hypothetical protein
MSKSRKEENLESLETLISQINDLLNEIKEEQIKLKKDVANNHKTNMQKFSKLIEYTKIADMTNTVFEQRISSIEKLLYEVFKS